jgi:hypothetical protein
MPTPAPVTRAVQPLRLGVEAEDRPHQDGDGQHAADPRQGHRRIAEGNPGRDKHDRIDDRPGQQERHARGQRRSLVHEATGDRHDAALADREQHPEQSTGQRPAQPSFGDPAADLVGRDERLEGSGGEHADQQERQRLDVDAQHHGQQGVEAIRDLVGRATRERRAAERQGYQQESGSQEPEGTRREGRGQAGLDGRWRGGSQDGIIHGRCGTLRRRFEACTSLGAAERWHYSAV